MLVPGSGLRKRWRSFKSPRWETLTNSWGWMPESSDRHPSEIGRSFHRRDVATHGATAQDPLRRPWAKKKCRNSDRQVKDALTAWAQSNIPDTLGHLDLNPGNILISPDQCVFLDWAEAYVGPPFLTFQYLIEHLSQTKQEGLIGSQLLVDHYFFKLAWLCIARCGHFRAATDASSCGVRLCYSHRLVRSAPFEGRAFPGLLAQSNATNAAGSERVRRQPNACRVCLKAMAILGGSEKELGRC